MAKRKQKRVEIDGITRWVSGKNEKDVFENLVQLVRNTDSGTTNTKQGKPEASFQEYTNNWYELYKVKKIKHRERQNHQTLFNKHLFPFFGNMKLSEIATDDIQRFFIQKDDEGYAASTIHKMDVLIKQIFRSALEDDVIRKNPADSDRLNYNDKEVKRKALTMGEMITLYHSLSSLVKPQDRLLIAIPAFSGTRRGETLALCWEDIDWKDRILHVHQAISFENGKPRVGKPKTDAGTRDIPLDNRLASMLEPLKKETGFIIGDGFKPITECTYRCSWKRISKAIELKGTTAHTLRHTFITFAESSGVDVKTLQSIAGHADVETTLNRYTHQRKDILKDAGQVIDKVFSQIN